MYLQNVRMLYHFVYSLVILLSTFIPDQSFPAEACRMCTWKTVKSF